MPAVRMTKVMPSAISPVIEICRMTLNRLSGSRKRGFEHARRSTISTSRKISGAKRVEQAEATSTPLRSALARRRSCSSPRSCRRACVERHQLHQLLLAWPRRAGISPVIAALAHGDDAVADRQHLGQLRRDQR